MTRLTDLLIGNEEAEILKLSFRGGGVDVNKDFQDLTINDLSRISFVLIRSKYPHGTCPACILSAEVITILTDRAIRNKMDLF